MAENADRFVEAYNAIDRHLRRLSGADRGRSFSSVVKEVAERDAAVRRRADDLLEYADLRNAIVHDSHGGRVIAEPFPETADNIEKLRNLLTSPPLVGNRFNDTVHLVAPTDQIGQATSIMKDGLYSQLPVYEHEQFVGLLTVATIVWWLSAELERHEGLLEEQPVSDVLEFTEDAAHHVEFVSRDTTIFDTVSEFEEHQRNGHPLEAVLITHSGARNQKPIGIVTAHDLPEMYEAIGG